MPVVLYVVLSVVAVAGFVAVPEIVQRISKARKDAERRRKRELRRSTRVQRRLDKQLARDKQAAAAEIANGRQWIRDNASIVAQNLTMRFQPMLDRLRSDALRLRAYAVDRKTEANKMTAAAAKAVDRTPKYLRSVNARSVAVCVGAVAFLAVLIPLAVLDYPIFAARFNKVLASVLTLLTLSALIGSAWLFLAGIGVHAGQGRAWPPHLRRLAAGVGLLSLCGSLLWLVSIAPYRTAADSARKIQAAQTAYDLEARKVAGGQGSIALEKSLHQQLLDAEEAARQTALMDQASVAVASVIEVLFFEAFLAASPIVQLCSAQKKAKQAHAVAEAADNSAAAAEAEIPVAISRFAGEVFDHLAIEHQVTDPNTALAEGMAAARQASGVGRAILETPLVISPAAETEGETPPTPTEAPPREPTDSVGPQPAPEAEVSTLDDEFIDDNRTAPDIDDVAA